MPQENWSSIIDYAYRLVSEANLDFGFAQGNGLGAILLAVVALAALKSKMRLGPPIIKLIGTMRKR